MAAEGSLLSVFQSSAAPKDGCDTISFNIQNPTGSISILSRPEGRLRCGRHRHVPAAFRISILSRPEGRLRSGRRIAHNVDVGDFNPQPPRRTAAIRSGSWTQRHRRYFNPQPPRRTAAIAGAEGAGERTKISILSRPEGRLRYNFKTPLATSKKFQSSAAPKDGCDVAGLASPPGALNFNPQPPRRTAAIIRAPRCAARAAISILSRPEGRLRSAASPTPSA